MGRWPKTQQCVPKMPSLIISAWRVPLGPQPWALRRMQESNSKLPPKTQWSGLLREGKAKGNIWDGAIRCHLRTETHPRSDKMEQSLGQGAGTGEGKFQHAFKAYTEEGMALLPWNPLSSRHTLFLISLPAISLVSTVKLMTRERT